jgi:cyclic beta-1,2-glucan synthetase
MDSARSLLWDPATRLMRLLDPPLAQAQPDAGYIQAYPPGVRENGGQYNHAGVWYLMAQAQRGDADGAWQTFTRLSPAHRSADPRQGAVYGLEPYVMAGDVCTQPPYVGRGGWSWYTGSAAWMHRAALESICGLERGPGKIRVHPHLPSHWPQVTLTLQHEGRDVVVVICQASARAEMDQAKAAGATDLDVGAWLELEHGQRHLVVQATSAPASPVAGATP